MSSLIHEAVCFDSAQKRFFWYDHFIGDQVKDEWTQATGGTGTIAVQDLQTGGVVRLALPAAGDTAVLNWNTIRSLHVDKRVSMELRILTDVANADRYFEMWLLFDANNGVFIRISTVNLIIRTINGGAQTSVVTGQAVDTNYHIYRMEAHLHGGSHVHFYFDGTELTGSPISTNIPDDAADYLQPLLSGINLGGVGGAVNIDMDYVVIRQDR